MQRDGLSRTISVECRIVHICAGCGDISAIGFNPEETAEILPSPVLNAYFGDIRNKTAVKCVPEDKGLEIESFMISCGNLL